MTFTSGGFLEGSNREFSPSSILLRGEEYSYRSGSLWTFALCAATAPSFPLCFSDGAYLRSGLSASGSVLTSKAKISGTLLVVCSPEKYIALG